VREGNNIDERRLQEETVAGETPPMTAEEFDNTPEFRRFRSGMKKLLKVSNAELDRRVEEHTARKRK
jgi:hypothetical protein